MPHATRLLRFSVPLALLATSLMAQPGPTPLTAVRVASGLANPLYVTAPPGDESRLFVVEQSSGLIRIVRNGSVLARPFLDVRTLILTGGERGLLGLAFDPQYAGNGRFYVNYTRAGDGATVVARYTVSASDPDVADPASAAIVIGPIAQPFANHNGGCLQFGPDGHLYIGMGDGGSAGDPSCNAQRGNTLLGKLLRLDVRGASGYAIPPTNPFVNDPSVMDEIWATGLRNPWRFSFDRLTGDLYLGDVGQGALEEISFEKGGGPGGLNFGWKIMEGTACYSRTNCASSVPPCNDPLLTLPIHEYPHAQGCSVTGGYVYRGCAIPDLRGTYFFADYCSARIWSFRYSGSVTELRERTAELAPGGGLAINSITSFGEDARGELYIVDRGGEVFRIAARLPAPATDLGYAKVGGSGRPPRFAACGLLNRANSAEFLLLDAPPGRAAVLVVSDQANPTGMFGGTLVPLPLAFAVLVMTTAEGKVGFTVPGGAGPFDAYAQFLIEDPGATMGVGFSNALKCTFLP